MRDADTYRTERRSAWAATRVIAQPGYPSWWAFNRPLSGGKWHIGSVQFPKVNMRSRKIGRSKYMPHESVKRGGTGPVFA